MDKSKWWQKSSILLRWSIFVFVTALTGVIIYLAFSPLGATVNYKVSADNTASGKIKISNPFTSEVSVKETNRGMELKSSSAKITSDAVQISFQVPFQKLKKAVVKLKYRYQGDPRSFFCGFVLKKRSSNFELKTIQEPSLDLLGWESVSGNGLVLYQKHKVFESVGEFLDAVPTFKPSNPSYEYRPLIATYEYSLVQPRPDIDLSRVNEGTTVDATLRGEHTAYVYVKDKPLELELQKMDMNLAVGEDPLNIIVFSGDEEIETLLVPDDGDTSADHRLTGPTTVKLRIPNLKEGSYEIKFDCSDDVLLKGIKSSQNYLVFLYKVFLADNPVYGSGPAKSITLHTDANVLSMTAFHQEALQTVIINGQTKMSINEQNTTFPFESIDPFAEVTTEKGGITVESTELTCFAFNKNSYYDPFPIKAEEFSAESNIQKLDYIITTYKRPKKEGKWYITKLTFDLEDAVVEDYYFNFRLSCPGLFKWNNPISIGSLEVMLEKAD